MKVPRVESKLRVFSFKIQFRSQVRQSTLSYGFYIFTCLYNIFFYHMLMHLLPFKILFQVAELSGNLNIVNSVAKEVCNPFWCLFFFTIDYLITEIFCLSDQKFCQTEKDHADNFVSGKCIKSRNSQGWVQTWCFSINWSYTSYCQSTCFMYNYVTLPTALSSLLIQPNGIKSWI